MQPLATSLTSLPDEILCYIASYLDLKNVRALALTCGRLNAVASEPNLWREFYLRRWPGRDWPELSEVPWKVRYQRRVKEVHDRVRPLLLRRAAIDHRTNIPEILNFLREEGHVGLTPDSAARYLASVECDPLSLGYFLAHSPDVCKAFVACAIPLASVEVDEAFRLFLKRISIPSQSQFLNRLISGFAAAYYKANSTKTCYPSEEAVYIITFTVVVLNVDIHSPMVTNKMKKDSWINLVRASLDHSNIPIAPEIDDLLSRVWERTVSQSLHPPAPAEPSLWQRVRTWVGM